MKLDRRIVLGLSCYALAASLAPIRVALAEAEIKALKLIESLGPLSIVRTLLDLLRPALQQELKCDVAVQTVPGHDGFDAIHAVLAPGGSELRLLGTAIMATQYAEGMVKTDIRLEALVPIVKLTNGFSVALFAKQGGPLKAWSDLAAAKPLKVSCPERATASYVAALMMERKGGIATEVSLRPSIAEVMDDVTTGRADVGIARTTLVAGQLDRLQPIISFGAERSGVLSHTPTFAEVTGKPKLAFAESVGVFAPPRERTLAARLTAAFIAAGDDPDVLDRAEAANLPLAIRGPDIVVETMKRNRRVLQRILG
jgi:tripartite-type tricarboxylate transporter receptor subunit TctC